MKLLVTIFFLSKFLFPIELNAQSISDSSYFKNDSIKYDVLWVNNPNTKKPQKLGHFVTIDMTSEMKKNLKAKNKEFWMHKLESTDLDWATNLILYYLFKREALSIISINGDMEKWKLFKPAELKYWNEWLGQNLKN